MAKWFTREGIYYLSLFSQIGLTIVLYLGAFFFLYRFLASRGWGHPLLLFLCIVLGLILAYYRVYCLIMKK